MDWNALRDFLAVADTGSLSSAARRLKVSQPTVGRRIEQLEQQLNSILFVRSARGLSLTESGENILASARQMEEFSIGIERLVTGENQQLEGLVRVSLTETLGAQWLPGRLLEFHQNYPSLHLELHVDDHAVNLTKREADIAVRLARPQQPDLVARRVGELRFGLYGSIDYLQRHGIPTEISELKQHYHVGYDQGMSNYSAIQRLEGLFTADNIRHRSNSRIGQLEATASGIGLAALTCISADQDQRLQRVLGEGIDYGREIWLVTHSDLFRSIRIRTVFDFLATALEQDKTPLAGAKPAGE